METITALKSAILGFGNPVRSDDAIGIYIVNELQRHLHNRDDISVFDMGISAFVGKVIGSSKKMFVPTK